MVGRRSSTRAGSGGRPNVCHCKQCDLRGAIFIHTVRLIFFFFGCFRDLLWFNQNRILRIRPRMKFGVSCREMRAKPSSAPASAVVHGRPPHAGAQRRWPCILVWTLPLLLFSLHHGRACVAAGRSSAPSAPATPFSFLCVAGSPMSGALGARQGGRDGRAHVALLPRGRRRPPSRCIAGGWTAGGFLGGASAPV